MNMQYTILENGFDFILNSLNGLNIANEHNLDDLARHRLIKYSLLHLSSGIELVLKHILMENHWTYVFSDMNNAQKSKLLVGNFKSVDSETILIRLKNLCDIDLSSHDLQGLAALRKKRNKLEHFDFSEPILSVESTIHKCITIIIEIIITYYDIKKFSENEKDLFNEIKQHMLLQSKHYDDVKRIAAKELELSNMKKYVSMCPKCSEDFLIWNDDKTVKCFFCHYEDSSDNASLLYNNTFIFKDEDNFTLDYNDSNKLYECPHCCSKAVQIDSNKIAYCRECKMSGLISFGQCDDCGKLFVFLIDEPKTICPYCSGYQTNFFDDE